MEAGNEPEKLLKSRNIDLRFRSEERFGIWPWMAFRLKLKTLSWSSEFKTSSSKTPVRYRFSRTSFETLPFKQAFTPCQLQTLLTSLSCHCSEFNGSIDDFRAKSASASSERTRCGAEIEEISSSSKARKKPINGCWKRRI
ncbi:hypothetical protein QQ045_001136 [Rhodiola kirilowii]